jgi:hypothetical protein
MSGFKRPSAGAGKTDLKRLKPSRVQTPQCNPFFRRKAIFPNNFAECGKIRSFWPLVPLETFQT